MEYKVVGDMEGGCKKGVARGSGWGGFSGSEYREMLRKIVKLKGR